MTGLSDAPDAPRFAYPVALDVHDVAVLVVGGGAVAARKVAGLASAGAAVTVVAPELSAAMAAEIDVGHVAAVRERPYRRDDLDGVRLAVTATGVDEVDEAVATDATDAGVWVNAADRRDHCGFILPAVARNGPLTIAVTTDGTSPALAGRLRDRAGELLTAEIVALAERLTVERAELRASGRSTEDYDWSAQIDAVIDRPER